MWFLRRKIFYKQTFHTNFFHIFDDITELNPLCFPPSLPLALLSTEKEEGWLINLFSQRKYFFPSYLIQKDFFLTLIPSLPPKTLNIIYRFSKEIKKEIQSLAISGILPWNNPLLYQKVSIRLSTSPWYTVPNYGFSRELDSAALLKKVFYFTLAFDSDHKTVQKISEFFVYVSLHLSVCEIFVVTVCQHWSVFMPPQIISYTT